MILQSYTVCLTDRYWLLDAVVCCPFIAVNNYHTVNMLLYYKNCTCSDMRVHVLFFKQQILISILTKHDLFHISIMLAGHQKITSFFVYIDWLCAML